ncbi:hypothetical protein HY485_03030 [Candidatus Woesearchaeota archaeon]|nr:hypothetical protein [Candidatus Woesearchaeota archaeon]
MRFILGYEGYRKRMLIIPAEITTPLDVFHDIAAELGDTNQHIEDAKGQQCFFYQFTKETESADSSPRFIFANVMQPPRLGSELWQKYAGPHGVRMIVTFEESNRSHVDQFVSELMQQLHIEEIGPREERQITKFEEVHTWYIQNYSYVSNLEAQINEALKGKKL